MIVVIRLDGNDRCARAGRCSPRAERIAKGAAVGTATATGGLLALGTVLALAEHDVTQVIAPLAFTIDVIRTVVWLASIVWTPAVLTAPWLLVLGLWNTGRRGQAAPQWSLPAAQRSGDGEPTTPSIVVTALRDLGIAALRGAIRTMEDNGAAMLGPIRIAGCGVRATLDTREAATDSE